MEQDETPNNVYRSFPESNGAIRRSGDRGACAAPASGRGVERRPRAVYHHGHGDQDDLGEPLRSRRVSLERRSWAPASRPFLWAAAALAAGAAIAAGQAVVDQRSAAPHQRSAVASEAPLERHVLAWPKRVTVVAHHRPAGARHAADPNRRTRR